jgi:hypothetical protein
MSGMQANEWGNTISGIEQWVRTKRFPRGKNLWCTGVMQTDHPDASWFWRGSGSNQVRFWDKFWCRVDLPAISRQATFVADPMSTGTQVKRLVYREIGLRSTPSGSTPNSPGGSGTPAPPSGGGGGGGIGPGDITYVTEDDAEGWYEEDIFDFVSCFGIKRYGWRDNGGIDDEFRRFKCYGDRGAATCTFETWGIEGRTSDYYRMRLVDGTLDCY